MELVAVDWFKDVKRMDHVAKRKGCAVQVSSYLRLDIIDKSAVKKVNNHTVVKLNC